MLKYRLPSAILLIAVFALAIWGLYNPWLFWLLPAVTLALALLAAHETLGLLKACEPYRAWAFFGTVLIMGAAFLFFRYPAFARGRIIVSFVLLLVFTATFLLPLVLSKIQGAMMSVASTFLTFLYVPVTLSCLLGVAFIGYRFGRLDGRFFLPYFVAIIKGADIGAYLVGTAFAKSPLGSHKFVPEVSPKKSVEGLFGGIVFSLAVGILGALYLPNVSEAMERLGGGIMRDPELGRIVGASVISLILCLLSVVGDLVESVFKRDSGVKDSSGLIPGMGGILDVADSLLLAAPFVYAITLTISRF